MKRFKGIGRLFAEEWQQALKNEGVFYTPVPTEAMTTAELESIAKTLQDLIDYWLNQVISNTSEEAILNSQAIADLQQSKLNSVTEILARRLPASNTGGLVTEVPQPQQEKSWLPIILIGAVAIYFFTRKKKTA